MSIRDSRAPRDMRASDFSCPSVTTADTFAEVWSVYSRTVRHHAATEGGGMAFSSAGDGERERRKARMVRFCGAGQGPYQMGCTVMAAARTGPMWYSSFTNSDEPSNFLDVPSPATSSPVPLLLGHGRHATASGGATRRTAKRMPRGCIAAGFSGVGGRAGGGLRWILGSGIRMLYRKKGGNGAEQRVRVCEQGVRL
uniref:Uncharacterized protein n=1 Tax=Arundo donax TaxID=35708 RepID=A0A0A9ERK6_ARUDO